MQVLGDISYTRRRRIGSSQGANSEVYEIDEPQLGGVLAVKEIDKTDLDPAAYFKEAQTLHASKHENIVHIQYACATADKICLVMPLYTKGCVADRIKDGPMNQREAVGVSIAVLSALGHVHSKGYIHLDVKPSNVLFSDTDAPLLSDFGESRLLSKLGTVTGPRAYVWAYPPELYSAGVATVHSDIYQAGLLLYRMLNGDPVWHAQWPADHETDKMKALTLKGKLPNRNCFLPHVHQRLRTLVRKALQVDPAKRFNTAAEFRRALGRVHISADWIVETSSDGT